MLVSSGLSGKCISRGKFGQHCLSHRPPICSALKFCKRHWGKSRIRQILSEGSELKPLWLIRHCECWELLWEEYLQACVWLQGAGTREGPHCREESTGPVANLLCPSQSFVWGLLNLPPESPAGSGWYRLFRGAIEKDPLLPDIKRPKGSK